MMDDLSLKVDSIVVSDDFSFNADLSGINLGLGSPSCCFINSFIKNVSSKMHPRFNLYKKAIESNQEERRRQLLLEQKEKRRQQLDACRTDLAVSSNSQKVEEDEENVQQVKKSQSKRLQHSNHQFQDRLMFSEWLEEIPTDFESSWICVLCPAGKRCLVVAVDGSTTVFNKGGKFICRHSSSLPGGSRDKRLGETILDCIYDEARRTYFILDCLMWKSHPITETESEFRFYWLNCKLEECTDVGKSSSENPYIFKDIPRFADCTSDNIQQKLQTPFEFILDGMLFFHRECHYSRGHTPLVSWLKPYMLPDILGYPVPEWIVNTAPSDYTSARSIIKQSNSEIQKFKENMNNRNKKSPKNNRLYVTPPDLNCDQRVEMMSSEDGNLDDDMEHT